LPFAVGKTTATTKATFQQPNGNLGIVSTSTRGRGSHRQLATVRSRSLQQFLLAGSHALHIRHHNRRSALNRVAAKKAIHVLQVVVASNGDGTRHGASKVGQTIDIS